MLVPSGRHEDIRDDAADAAKESSERTGEQSITRLCGRASTQPDHEETSWDQHHPGQLHGEKSKLVMKLIVGDEVRLCYSDHDAQSSYQSAGGKRQECSSTCHGVPSSNRCQTQLD
jgi:hypothetical protein